MITYVLILVLNGVPTTPATPPLTQAQCQKAGADWIAASSKLRGMSKGEFLCVPVEHS